MLRLLLPDLTREQLSTRRAIFEQNRASLETLLATKTIKQRTPEWYEARAGLITASDFAQALGKGKFGTQKEFFWKKVVPEPPDVWQKLANCPPIKWGTMYEDVAQEIYSFRNSVRVYEFGLVKHPTIDFLGASPDGITENGVMLEIKCPYRRKIDPGSVPEQYFYQIQGQLDVCGLDECDYLEVSLEEVSRDEFFCFGSDGERGIVVETFEEETNKSLYEYSGVFDTAEDLVKLESRERLPKVKFHYWRLVKYSCVRVVKDREFVREMVESLSSSWSRIVAYRGDISLMEKEIGLPPQPVEKPKPQYAFRETLFDDRDLQGVEDGSGDGIGDGIGDEIGHGDGIGDEVGECLRDYAFREAPERDSSVQRDPREFQMKKVKYAFR